MYSNIKAYSQFRHLRYIDPALCYNYLPLVTSNMNETRLARSSTSHFIKHFTNLDLLLLVMPLFNGVLQGN